MEHQRKVRFVRPKRPDHFFGTNGGEGSGKPTGPNLKDKLENLLKFLKNVTTGNTDLEQELMKEVINLQAEITDKITHWSQNPLNQKDVNALEERVALLFGKVAMQGYHVASPSSVSETSRLSMGDPGSTTSISSPGRGESSTVQTGLNTPPGRRRTLSEPSAPIPQPQQIVMTQPPDPNLIQSTHTTTSRVSFMEEKDYTPAIHRFELNAYEMIENLSNLKRKKNRELIHSVYTILVQSWPQNIATSFKSHTLVRFIIHCGSGMFTEDSSVKIIGNANQDTINEIFGRKKLIRRSDDTQRSLVGSRFINDLNDEQLDRYRQTMYGIRTSNIPNPDDNVQDLDTTNVSDVDPTRAIYTPMMDEDRDILWNLAQNGDRVTVDVGNDYLSINKDTDINGRPSISETRWRILEIQMKDEIYNSLLASYDLLKRNTINLPSFEDLIRKPSLINDDVQSNHLSDFSDLISLIRLDVSKYHTLTQNRNIHFVPLLISQHNIQKNIIVSRFQGRYGKRQLTPNANSTFNNLLNKRNQSRAFDSVPYTGLWS